MICSITNIGECVVEFLFKFILDLINTVIKPLLNLIKFFLSEPVNTSLFSEPWSIIIYILSLTYGLILVYIGLKFMLSGNSPEQRESAKSSLRNIIIMIILIQSSFIIYSLILDISGALTGTILDLTGDDFFRLTFNSFSSFALELIFLGLYLLHLLVVLLILIIRYIVVSAGVLFFVLGIFFYFISLLQNFGKLILYTLGTLIFIPFFYSIVFLAASRIIELSIFSHIKILIMIGSLDIIILGTLIMLLFVLIKAALKIAGPVSKLVTIVSSVAAAI
ncbi:hypothetical protein GOV12_04460 [Candidatus Pacearchaeota archaeon]|nr:hypothetical protein [Candidatus Pacearchaeota archaeon]